MAKKLALTVLAATIATLSGCNILGPILYLFAPEPTVTVEAEYADLPGHSIAVVVYADISLEYEYPNARRELAAYLSHGLAKTVDDLTIIDPMVTLQFQEENLSVFVWKFFDCPEKLSAILFHNQVFFGTRIIADYRIYFVTLRSDAPPAFKAVDAGIFDYRIHIWIKRSRCVNPGNRFVNFEKYFLAHIGSVFPITEKEVRSTIYPLEIDMNKMSECFFVSRFCLLNESCFHSILGIRSLETLYSTKLHKNT